jgi:hypothetical protein
MNTSTVILVTETIKSFTDDVIVVKHSSRWTRTLSLRRETWVRIPYALLKEWNISIKVEYRTVTAKARERYPYIPLK